MRNRKPTLALQTMQPMIKPGLKPIKQIELATKWRPLVPKEFHDDVCPIPPKALLDKFKEDKSTKKNAEDPNTSPIDRMKVAQLKEALVALNLSNIGLKAVLVARLKEHTMREKVTSQEHTNTELDQV